MQLQNVAMDQSKVSRLLCAGGQCRHAPGGLRIPDQRRHRRRGARGDYDSRWRAVKSSSAVGSAAASAGSPGSWRRSPGATQAVWQARPFEHDVSIQSRVEDSLSTHLGLARSSFCIAVGCSCCGTVAAAGAINGLGCQTCLHVCRTCRSQHSSGS